MTEHLLLTVRSGGESVQLELGTSPPVLTEHVEAKIAAGSPAEFILSGIESPRFIANLSIEGIGRIETFAERIGSDLILTPFDSRSPLDLIIGVARIVIRVSRGPGLFETLYAEPLEVLLRPGMPAENLKGMLAYVERHTTDLFDGDDVLGKARLSVLEERLALLAEIESVYEKHYPYFRENARYTLKGTPKPVNIEKVKTFASGAAGWVANRPHELERVMPGQGFRACGRSWLPRHAPGLSNVHDLNIPENRAVAGFAATLAKEAANLADELAFSESPKDGEFMSLAKIGESLAARECVALRIFSRAFGRLGRLYRSAIGVNGQPVRRLPPASAHFFETAPYRIIYKLMKKWFELEPADVAAIKKRLAALTGPRLYEYFVLARLIDGFTELGFTLEESRLFDYSSDDRNYAAKSGAVSANTFRFRSGDEVLTLWYQPVIAGRRYTGANGLELVRASSLAYRTDVDDAGGRLEPGTTDYYTPDYVVSLTSQGRTVWSILDAKYSTVGKARSSQIVPLAFRYLISVHPVRSEDVVAGLRLFCGFTHEKEAALSDGSIFDSASALGLKTRPNIVLERLNAIDAGGKNPAKSVLKELRTASRRA